MAKLKDLVKENFSLVGGVVSTPAINAGYGSLSQIVKEKYGESSDNSKVSTEQVSEALQNYNKLGETLYQQQTLKETAKSLSQIAEDASSVQQRLSALYEDMGVILNRYYDIPETHIPGHDDDDRDVRSKDSIEEGDYEQFFQSAMKKFGIKSPDELGDDEKKKKFFNYVDKNYKAKAEGKKDSEEAQQPGKRDDDKDIKYY